MKAILFFIILLSSLSLNAQWIKAGDGEILYLVDERPKQFYIIEVDMYYWDGNTLHVKFTVYDEATKKNIRMWRTLKDAKGTYRIIYEHDLKDYLKNHKCQIKYADKDSNKWGVPIPKQGYTGNEKALVKVFHQKEKDGSQYNYASPAVPQRIANESWRYNYLSDRHRI